MAVHMHFYKASQPDGTRLLDDMRFKDYLHALHHGTSNVKPQAGDLERLRGIAFEVLTKLKSPLVRQER